MYFAFELDFLFVLEGGGEGTVSYIAPCAGLMTGLLGKGGVELTLYGAYHFANRVLPLKGTS
jgi:hypothetical protein